VTPLNRLGTTRQLIAEAGRFCANLLAADQVDLARRVARRGDRFADLAYSLGALDLPMIDRAVVEIECELENSIQFGTYDLLVGRVTSLRKGSENDVLTYCDHTFGAHVPLEQRRA
jgi:3-hydroxy-9,10-secoandrosta-1,3,5(10)-triene-9,17-dione monooxygenase reductase component